MEKKKDAICIEVGCAIIERKGEILIARRKPGGHLGGYWEFPGGKKEELESIEECLIREVEEELGILIRPRRFLRNVIHSYPSKKLSLHFYLCAWLSGVPVKKDCSDFRWVKPEGLLSFLFPPADRDMIQELIRKKKFYFENPAIHY